MRLGTSNKIIYQVGLGLIFLGVGVLSGWLLRGEYGKPVVKSDTNQQALRLAGYTFVSPLLVCDTSLSDTAPELVTLKSVIEEVVSTSQKNKVVTATSVYFRDLKTGQEVIVNGEERFFPASLKKIPLMMKLYREAQSRPESLQEKRLLTGNQDFNVGAAIPPKSVPVYGKSYSQDELISYMVKYSDNISFQVLLNALGEEKFNKVFTDLKLFYPDTVVSINDYITPFQFSLFFRTLYNATYLSAEYSERALKLLSETDFNDGIVAGVPKGVAVSHKFGVGVVNQQDGTARGELHDCGIVYQQDNPYLLCVMTKSEAEIAKVTGVIARISSVVYRAAEGNYQ
jgi:beta-lactamase class A